MKNIFDSVASIRRGDAGKVSSKILREWLTRFALPTQFFARVAIPPGRYTDKEIEKVLNSKIGGILEIDRCHIVCDKGVRLPSSQPTHFSRCLFSAPGTGGTKVEVKFQTSPNNRGVVPIRENDITFYPIIPGRYE
jgi:hypothetical protein